MGQTFKNFTDLDAAMHNARVAAGKGEAVVPQQFDALSDEEAKLHQLIYDYCRQRRWLVVHSRMDRPTTTAPGIPDFIIAADDGKTHWIEAKAKGKKPSREQLGTLHWLESLKHNADWVESFPEFLAVVHREVQEHGRGTPQPKDTE